MPTPSPLRPRHPSTHHHLLSHRPAPRHFPASPAHSRPLCSFYCAAIRFPLPLRPREDVSLFSPFRPCARCCCIISPTSVLSPRAPLSPSRSPLGSSRLWDNYLSIWRTVCSRAMRRWRDTACQNGIAGRDRAEIKSGRDIRDMQSSRGPGSGIFRTNEREHTSVGRREAGKFSR